MSIPGDFGLKIESQNAESEAVPFDSDSKLVMGQPNTR